MTSTRSRRLGVAAWLDLTTPDVEQAASFYADLLGWELASADTPVGRYVTGSIGDGPVAGMMAPTPDQAGAPPAWSVFFGVVDVQGAYDHARRRGGTGLQPPTEVPGGDRITVVTDPAGAVVGLVQSSGRTLLAWATRGAGAWVETQSRDVDASAAFYRALLGWTTGPDTDGYRVFERDGEPVAGVMAMPAEVPPEVPSWWMPYFAVDDVDRACVRAGELGGTVLVSPMTVQDMRFVVLADPLGAAFAVLQSA